MIERYQKPVALAAAVFVTACTSNSPGVTPSPIVINTPPTIREVRIENPRVEADRDVQVTAVVTDAETPIDRLTYVWSASPVAGVFTGTGPTVRWRAPSGEKTPDLYTLSVTVTETFIAGGQERQNRVSSATQVHYNNSPAEVNGLAVGFYSDFGNYSTSAAERVRNFSDSCPGKRDELAQIQANRNRLDFRIAGSRLHDTPRITFNAGLTFGSFLQSCTFEDSATTGDRHRVVVDGDCFLTAVYDNWQWRLCDSFFLNGSAMVTPGLPGRVPGRMIQQLP